MQPVDRNIHMFFAIKTQMYTNTSSIKTTIFSMLMLYALLFKLYNLLFVNYAFFKTINQLICIFNNLLYIIKSQL
jgi:hypothetical protein